MKIEAMAALALIGACLASGRAAADPFLFEFDYDLIHLAEGGELVVYEPQNLKGFQFVI